MEPMPELRKQMNFYQSAPVWIEAGALPNTTKKAKPSGLKNMSKGLVIHVVDAYYRGSVFSGSFLLAEDVSEKEKTKRRVKVYCCWFGHRLKEREPSFLVNLKTATFSDGGEVATNLSN